MEALPRFFIELTLRDLALLVVAGVAALALRKAQPAVRHAVWTSAVAGMLLLPLLQTGVPGWTFPVWIERAASVSQSLDITDPQVVNAIATVPSLPRKEPSRPVNPHAILLSIYLAGASALLIRQAWSSMTLRRLLKRSQTVDVEGFAAAAQAVGFTGRLPEVRESCEVRVPFTYGVSAPVIVLPDDWREWSHPKRLAVLAHETAHVARRDWLAGRVAAVNRAVNWWNPAAWWLERHLAALAEEAVDEAALAAVGDVKHYASAVVDFAIAMQGKRLGSMEATAMARSTKVGRRVERILASQGAGASGLKRGVFSTVAALAAPLILVAASVLPEVRHVGPNEPLVAAIFAPSAPEVRLETAAALPASAPQQLDPVQAQAMSVQGLEAGLARNPNSVEVRGELMRLYLAAGDRDKARQQAWWLVENAPASREAYNATRALLVPGRSLIRDDAERDRLRNIWRSHARNHSTDPKVLATASLTFFGTFDFFEAEDLILKARRLEPDNRGYLGQLASIYVTALDPPMNASAMAPDIESFRRKAANELGTSPDAQLVGLAGEMLTSSQTITVTGHNPQQEAELRERLKKRNELATKYLKRAQVLDPEDVRWRVSLLRASAEPHIVNIVPAEPGVKRITVGGSVQQANIVRKVEPEYPPLARQARIQGTVRFTAVLATDGSVKQLTLLGGHPLLVQAAKQAVEQWTFRPTLLNGEAVEVITNIDVGFTLPDAPAEAPRSEEAPDVHRIGGGVSAPVPISRVQPKFPSGVPDGTQEARVMLKIVIGTEGEVAEAEPLDGDPAFFEAAIEAVKQWKFEPGMKEGKPVKVSANVETNFRRY
ncbi:MAG TPA: M56 family metallopeptidase [Bryobacteraceae bacterium]|nr:M56 family metallopeptidase [Bryobacteraceae bacterium]